MSLQALGWAITKDLKHSDFKVLIFIANEADSSGQCFTGQALIAAKADIGERTLRASIARLRKMGLLHTERRSAKFTRGRLVDTIVLHLENLEHELPNARLTAEEIRELRRNRELYEVGDEPVDNSEVDQPAKSAGRYETPSQEQPAKSAGKSESTFNRQKTNVQPAKNERSTGKNEQPAFNRNARALIPLNPFNPSSSLHSSETQEAPVENGRMEDGGGASKKTSNDPTINELRRSLRRNGIPNPFSDEELKEAMQMVMRRYTDVGKTVTSPVGLMISTIRNEPGGLQAVIEQMYDMRTQAPEILQEEQPRASWCSTHSREYTGTKCPVCANSRVAALEHLQERETEPHLV